MRSGRNDPTERGDVDINVGERLRAIRTHRGLTLRTVSERARLSESFLSQAERGLTSISIASLQRVAAALSVSVAELFEADLTPRPSVLRVADRPGIAIGNLGRKYLLTAPLAQHMEVIVGELEPGGSTGDEPYAHNDSEELFFVIGGKVTLQLGDDFYDMEKGDSIAYRSSTPHRAMNVSDRGAEVMWVISPPSY